MKHVAKPMHTRVREEAIPQSSRVFAKLSGYVKWIPSGEIQTQVKNIYKKRRSIPNQKRWPKRSKDGLCEAETKKGVARCGLTVGRFAMWRT